MSRPWRDEWASGTGRGRHPGALFERYRAVTRDVRAAYLSVLGIGAPKDSAMKRVELGGRREPGARARGPSGRMRGKFIFAFAALTTAVACGHTGSGGVPSRAPVDARAAGGGAAAGPPQYVVADPSPRSNVVALRLGSGGALGLVVDKTRIVVGRGEPHVGSDVPERRLQACGPSLRAGRWLPLLDGERRLSRRLVRGHAEAARAVRRRIQNMSFAPKYLLVRTSNGERWALGAPVRRARGHRAARRARRRGPRRRSRARRSTTRALRSRAWISGAHWVDVTSQIKSSPTRVAVDRRRASGSSNRAAARSASSRTVSSPRSTSSRPSRPQRCAPATRAGAASRRRSAAAFHRRRVDRREHRDRRRAGRHRPRRRPHRRDRRHRHRKAPAGLALRGGPHRERRALRVRLARLGPERAAQPSSFVVSHTLSGDAPTVEQTFQDAGAVLSPPTTGGSRSRARARGRRRRRTIMACACGSPAAPGRTTTSRARRATAAEPT